MPAKKARVEEEVASPPAAEEEAAFQPPLPNEPAPTASSSSTADLGIIPGPIDEPITSLGDDDDQEGQSESSEGEWDPAEERLPGETSKKRKAKHDDKSSASKTKGKDKGKEKASEGEASEQPWQAVWAPEQNGT
jgi:hypothetical protein